jgi:GNAT superfamily N-acetyltransferase
VTPSSRPALFRVAGMQAFAMGAADMVELQRFFDANPEYFLAVTGQPPGLAAAQEEYEFSLPEGWTFGTRWLLGVADAAGTLVSMASVVSDLLAPGVWHIGLFILATHRHGSGDAYALYDGMERWAQRHGARWFRLGVVQRNARAERFWEKLGFVEVRMRRGIAMGELLNDVRVMVKPLAGGTLADYRLLVERDRPEPAVSAVKRQ